MSYRDAGRPYGIDHSTVRKWVARYKVHGLAGVTKKSAHYDANFKLSVLQRMWDDGLSYLETAVLFNIRGTHSISKWVKLYEAGGMEALTRRIRKPRAMPEPPMSKEPDIPQSDEDKNREELLAELNHLRMENAYLKKLEALTQDQPVLLKRKSSKR